MIPKVLADFQICISEPLRFFCQTIRCFTNKYIIHPNNRNYKYYRCIQPFYMQYKFGNRTILFWTIAPPPRENCPTDNCQLGKLPPDNFLPDNPYLKQLPPGKLPHSQTIIPRTIIPPCNSHLGKLPSDNCTSDNFLLG